MPPSVATFACLVLILTLFGFDRDRSAPRSKVLWIPIIWICLACSRSLGQWLGSSLEVGSTDGAFDQRLDGSPFDRSVYLILLVFGFCVVLSRSRRVKDIIKANPTILLFFLYCAASFLWSDFPVVAFKRWIKTLGDLIMILIVLTEEQPIAALKRLFVWATFLLIPLSALFIKYYPALGRGYGQWQGEVHYIGVTLNKNTLGSICLLFGLASAWRLLVAYRDEEGTDRMRHLVAHGVIMVIVLWLFWITNSMTSLVCFLMGNICLLAAHSRAVVKRPAIMPVLVVTCVATSVFVLFFGTSLLSLIGRDSTLTDRTDVWDLVLKLSDNPVVGAGFESFWLGPRLAKIWSVYTWGPTQAHNGYLEIFLNLGWVGLGMLALVIGAAYFAIMNSFRNKSPASSLMISYFVVGLIYNCTEAAFFRMMTPVWIFFLLSITKLPYLLPSESSSSVAGTVGQTFASRVVSQGHFRKVSRAAIKPGFGPLQRTGRFRLHSSKD